ncbi:MAG: hypothetical protein LUD15_10895 [Bacteroides sp.]|nr:hypothetical protein [Bacteroides sp.]
MTDLPIIFIFPGTSRNADDYLQGWLKSYRDKKEIVIALEFPAQYYSTSEYIEGNMFRNNQPVSEEEWSYFMIEPLFLYIKQKTGNTTTTYNMFGHSAGAQFVHRFVTFKQNTNLHKAIAANAGWYTVPNTSIAYPYGLKDSGYSDKTTLIHLFASQLIVALGDEDIYDDSSLRHTAEADTQGLYRYARGEHYYSESERISTENNFTLNWKKIIVKGVGHDFSGIMEQTGGQLF